VRNLRGFTLCGMATGLAFLCGCSGSEERPEPSAPFRWGGPTNIAMLPIVAEAKGFFRDAGLQTKPMYLQTGKTAMDAVVSGDLDAGILVETNIAFIRYQPGADIRVVASIMRKNDDAIVARSDRGIRKPTDLYDKTLAIVPATTSHRYADLFIDFYRLDRRRIHFANSTPLAIQAGVLSGNIVAGSIWEPFDYNLKNSLGDKVVRLHDPRIYTSYAVVALTAQGLMRNRARTVKFLQALIRARQYVLDHQEESVSLLAKEMGMSPEVLTAVWKNYQLDVALEDNLQQVFEDAGRWAKQAQSSLAGSATPSYAGVIDASVLKDAQSATAATVPQSHP
jgi:ABC-type nitrate/sulfonate/bicarbonate transport system substrate-binding protein